MKIQTVRSLGFLSALLAVGAIVSGCHDSEPAAQAKAPPIKNVNSKGLAKLSANEIDAKILAVQNNKTIPESAKPGIIQSIRAQGEP